MTNPMSMDPKLEAVLNNIQKADNEITDLCNEMYKQTDSVITMIDVLKQENEKLLQENKRLKAALKKSEHLRREQIVKGQQNPSHKSTENI